MILERGDMWDVFGKTGLFLITTNPIRCKDGAVVMGRGLAKEAKDKFPLLPFDFGKSLQTAERTQDSIDALHPLNVGIIGKYDGQTVGWFMTKYHWRDVSNLEVIEKSVQQLSRLLEVVDVERVDLNFPGIGNGKLKREWVLPLIAKLPDNVYVWEKADE